MALGGTIARSCEAGCVLTVDLAAAGAPTRGRLVRFEAWREELPNGAVTTRSTVPPPRWGLAELSAPSDPDMEKAARLIGDFAIALRAPVTLRYSRLVSRRRMTDHAESWQSRFIDVFALTGRIGLADGRFMSLGWSGHGDGFARLREGPDRTRIAWIARCAGAAAPTEPGLLPALLDPQPAALVAHEAVGHFSEAAADPALDLRHRIGCRLAGDGFNVHDDPTLAGAARYAFDDEGTEPIGPTRILADGVLTQQLHSRRSAEAASTLPTANSRAAQITLPPIPRLSNLVVPPGDTPRAALIDSIGSGLLIHHLSHGFSRGIEIEARIVLAEEVARGRPTGRFFSGGRVSERVDLLTRCVGRGTHSELSPNALCGKHGQILYDVGTVAPALSLSGLRIAA